MKWLIFLLLQIFVLTLGGYFLATYPGTLTVQWLGYQLETSLLVFVIALIVVSFIVGFVIKTLSSFLRVPDLLKARYHKYTYQKGIRALVCALTGLRAQDGKQAAKEAGYLRKFLQEETLATYFEAEAAIYCRDYVLAEKLFHALSERETFQFLGHAGLLRLSLVCGETQKALNSAMMAKKFYPLSSWVRNKIIEQAFIANKLDIALAEVEETMRLKIISNQNLKETKAQILFKLATHALQTKDLKTAVDYCHEAYELAQDKREIAHIYVGLLIEMNEEKRARHIIEQTWTLSPDEDLSKLYIDVMHPTSVLDRFKAIQRLASFSPHHPESFFICAQAAIDAKLWGQAHDHLNQLIAEGYTDERVSRLMSELEHAERLPT